MKKSACALLALLTFVGPARALAHHNSNAYFDTQQETTLEGTVTDFDWRNPHSYLYMETAGADGAATAWRIEGGPVALMRRMGWSHDTLRPGDAVTVTINPSRNPENRAGLLRNIVVAGRDVPPVDRQSGTQRLVQSGAAAPSRAQGLAGMWVTLLDIENPELIGFFNEPARRPLTPAGTAAVESFDERTMHTGLECIPYTAPLLMTVPDTKQIEVRDDVVLIRGEFDGTVRTVYLDGREAGAPTIHGHSTGHWDGGALLIETEHFAPHRMGNAFSLPSGARKRLTERLELDADGTTLTYGFELTDPDYLAEPVAGEVTWAYRPDITLELLECSLDNSRLYLED